jgi:hypothetical protein
VSDLPAAIAAAREALERVEHECSRTDDDAYLVECARAAARLKDLLAALDAAQGEAVVEFMGRRLTPEKTSECWGVLLCDFMQDPPKGTKLYLAPQATPAAVPAANVTPMRQPRADLARLVESINAAVYVNGDGLSVTEAIGALELAKLELLKEQEQ